MQNKLSTPNTVILAAGVVMLLGSFLSFYEFSISIAGFGRSGSFSAWGGADQFGIFGIATVIVLCGVVMAAHVAIETFANANLPVNVLGLTWDQVHLALGFQAAVMMLAFLVRAKPSVLDFGIGFWLMLLSGVALLVGAIMRANAAGTRPA